MVFETLLQRALGAMLSGHMLEHGGAFFDALRRSEVLDPAEAEQLETEWRALLERRRLEGEGAERALSDLMQRARDAVAKQVDPAGRE